MALERHRTYFREEAWNGENVGQLLNIEFLETEIPYCSLGQTKVKYTQLVTVKLEISYTVGLVPNLLLLRSGLIMVTIEYLLR